MSGLRIVHTILSKGFAGSERATAEMCNAHCREHEVLLILKRGHTSRNGVSIRQWLDPAVQVVEVGNWLPRAGMARALEQFRPDVIHAHLRRSTRLLARIRPPAPTIATLHLTANGPHFADMDGLICIAQWQHEDIPRGYRGRVFDINESLIPNRRLSASEIATLRRELGAAPGDYLVGGVGRLARSKGFDVLVEAFKRAHLPAARLVIIGEGRERTRLERALVPGISLPGFRSDAKDCYQAFDVFVSPSRSEPLGRVVLEALDAGVPVIASATRGPAEILSRYPGELFPIGDVDALAALLRRSHELRPPRLHHDLSAYHLPNIARETAAAYRELIDAKRLRLRAAAN
ncbi:MAG TPA: glycosyltransferase [Steroidobacteraceae bacterium]